MNFISGRHYRHSQIGSKGPINEDNSVILATITMSVLIAITAKYGFWPCQHRAMPEANLILQI